MKGGGRGYINNIYVRVTHVRVVNSDTTSPYIVLANSIIGKRDSEVEALAEL